MPAAHRFLHSLNLVHKTMLAGQLLLAVAAFALRYFDWIPATLQEQDQLLQVITLSLSAVAYFLGVRIFRQRLEQARDGGGSTREKAAVYRSASMLQWILLETAALFSLFSFLFTGNLAFLFLSLALMLFFYLGGPSRMKLMLLLRLREEEIDGLG